MNTENKVFNKLFSSEKIELESQKYEFEKSYTDLVSEFNSIKSIAPQLSKQISDVVEQMDKIKTIGKKEQDKIHDFSRECLKTMMALNQLGLKDSPEWTDIKEMDRATSKISNELFSGPNFKLFN